MTIEEKTLEDVANRWHIDTASFVREALGVGSVDDGKQIDHQQLLFLQTFDALVSAKEKRVRKRNLPQKKHFLQIKLELLSDQVKAVVRPPRSLGYPRKLYSCSKSVKFWLQPQNKTFKG